MIKLLIELLQKESLPRLLFYYNCSIIYIWRDRPKFWPDWFAPLLMPSLSKPSELCPARNWSSVNSRTLASDIFGPSTGPLNFFFCAWREKQIMQIHDYFNNKIITHISTKCKYTLSYLRNIMFFKKINSLKEFRIT